MALLREREEGKLADQWEVGEENMKGKRIVWSCNMMTMMMAVIS